jgi:DNA-binding CsgD family transcriptional regulator
MKSKCRGCLYYGHRTDTCDFYLITGERRGCPVEGCTRYVPGKSVARLAKFFAGTGDLPEADRRMLELYEQGLSDKEIAASIGRSRQLVGHWRRKMGLPSQLELSEEEDED